MKDEVISGMTAGNEVRYFAAYTRGVAEEARRRHNLSPVAAAALGRTLTAGAMMGAMCKNESDVLTLQIKGDGPIGGITVTANAAATVKFKCGSCSGKRHAERYQGCRTEGTLCGTD